MKMHYEVKDGDLKRALERSPQVLTREINKGLDKAALKMVVAAQKQIEENKSFGTSDLMRSITFKSSFSAFERIVYSGVKHSYFVENGSNGGAMPPAKPLIAWLRAKNGLSEKEAKRRVFPLARSIQDNGTKANPFMGPAFEKTESILIQIIEQSVARGCRASFGTI